jgi:hypothetical protein
VPTTPPTTVSDPVCTDLSGIVQLVGGDPLDCNLPGAPAAPTAPATGIVGPLLGRL